MRLSSNYFQTAIAQYKKISVSLSSNKSFFFRSNKRRILNCRGCWLIKRIFSLEKKIENISYFVLFGSWLSHNTKIKKRTKRMWKICKLPVFFVCHLIFTPTVLNELKVNKRPLTHSHLTTQSTIISSTLMSKTTTINGILIFSQDPNTWLLTFWFISVQFVF